MYLGQVTAGYSFMEGCSGCDAGEENDDLIYTVSSTGGKIRMDENKTFLQLCTIFLQ